VAKYSFLTLFNWYSALTPIMQDRGVTQTDIDDIRNALVIGVANEGVITRVRAAISKLGIPDDAFLVEVVPPTQQVADLQGVVRPVPSSVQIAFSGFLCIDETQVGFMTANDISSRALIALMSSGRMIRHSMDSPRSRRQSGSK